MHKNDNKKTLIFYIGENGKLTNDYFNSFRFFCFFIKSCIQYLPKDIYATIVSNSLQDLVSLTKGDHEFFIFVPNKFFYKNTNEDDPFFKWIISNGSNLKKRLIIVCLGDGAYENIVKLRSKKKEHIFLPFREFICCFYFTSGGTYHLNEDYWINPLVSIGYGCVSRKQFPNVKLIKFCDKIDKFFFYGSPTGWGGPQTNKRYQMFEILSRYKEDILDKFNVSIVKGRRWKKEWGELKIVNAQKRGMRHIFFFNNLNKYRFLLCPFGNSTIGSIRFFEALSVGSVAIANNTDELGLIGNLQHGFNYLSIGRDCENLEEIIKFCMDKKNFNELKEIAKNGLLSYEKFFRVSKDRYLTENGFLQVCERFNKQLNGFFNKYIEIKEKKVNITINNNLLKNRSLPLWILTNPRSGSTFLGRCLSETDCFDGNFKERINFSLNFYDMFFNLDHRIPFDKRRELIKQGLFNPPLCPRIHRKQFANVFLDSDYDIIKSKIPNIRYIYLTRRDKYSQAISNYFYVPDRHCREFKEYNEEVLVKTFNECCERENQWYSFLQNIDYVKVEFESIKEDPNKVLREILRCLNIYLSPETIDIIISKCIKSIHPLPIVFPETVEYKERLKQSIIKIRGEQIAEELDYNGIVNYPSLINRNIIKQKAKRI